MRRCPGSTTLSLSTTCVDPEAKKFLQKRRSFSAKKYTAIPEEIYHLLAVGFIREAHCPKWLSNVVLVKKPNCKWRICVDFIDLNKACLNDSFLLHPTLI